MQVKILLFATLKDLAGSNTLALTLPEDAATVQDVRRVLAEHYPAMAANLAAAIAAVNEEYAQNDVAVKAGDTIAFFPPVSGGSGYPEILRLAWEPVDHDELVAAVTVPETGAVCIFSGMVRGATEQPGHMPKTSHLEYEAYESMALAKLQQIADEIRERWPLVQGIALVQRLGRLEVGQNTIVIACSSAHRDQGCFEAARYGIDRLKEIVPVWKKEVGPDGTAWVEGAYYPTDADRKSGI